MQGYGERIREICSYFYKINTSNLGRKGYIKYLADKVGVNYQSIYCYINETQYPRPKFFKRLEKLGVNLNWVINGEGSMFGENKYIPKYNMFILLEDGIEKIKIPIGRVDKHNIPNLTESKSGFYIQTKFE